MVTGCRGLGEGDMLVGIGFSLEHSGMGVVCPRGAHTGLGSLLEGWTSPFCSCCPGLGLPPWGQGLQPGHRGRPSLLCAAEVVVTFPVTVRGHTFLCVGVPSAPALPSHWWGLLPRGLRLPLDLKAPGQSEAPEALGV